MKFFNIQKGDLIKYKHELILTICYTIALCIVYASWAYSELSKLWVSLLIILGFVLAGAISFVLWVYFKKRNEEPGKES